MQISVYKLEKEDTESLVSDKNQKSINIYYGSQIDFPQDLSYLHQFLSDKEVERSKRFFHKRDERTYVISHALLNKKISEQLGYDFNRIKINYFENKKPYIEGRPFDFNLSHSSDYFAFALSGSENHFVGVDIEIIKTKTDIVPIVNRYFHKNEIDYVLDNRLYAIKQHSRFYEIWTRKEAFLKMPGLGLSEKLSELDMTPGGHVITIQRTKTFDNHCFSHVRIYTLKMCGNLVLSLSTNRSLHIIPWSCKRF